MTSDQYYLHGVLLGGATWVGQLTDLTPASNTEFLTSFAAGSAVVPSFRGAYGTRPEARFSTPQLKTVLDACGMIGVGYAATNCDLYYLKAKNLEAREPIASGVHLLIRFRRSMLYWERITARTGQEAQVECRLVPTWDGTNVPVVGLGSQTIASNLMAGQEYKLGGVKFNGSFLDGVEGWTLELNPEVNEKKSDGNDFVSFFGIERHDPILTAETPDLDQWVSAGLDGVQITTLVAYLRKMSPDKTRAVADATAEHISFTAQDNPAGLATIVDNRGGIDDAAICGLRMGLRISSADTAHPLAVSTAAAIS